MAKNQLLYNVVLGGIKQSPEINGSNMWLRQRPVACLRVSCA